MKLKFLIILLLFYGCGLMETRDPEEPETTRSNFISPTTPDILFNNLVESFEEKITENYISCFVDASFLDEQYQFIPSASSLTRFSDLSNWDIESERQYFNNLKSSTEEDSPIVLSLENEYADIQIDNAVYEYDYSLTLTTDDESLSAEYEGSVRFTIQIDSRNWWVVTKWEDFESGTNPSWSELKGRLY
ncbi:MAG: hypothetical protein PVH88_21405 [Ignavibacteria bacterium]|jgi:hypothetical protein